MNKSIYFPDDAKTKVILERVKMWRKKRAEVLNIKEPSFGKAVLVGLKMLVSTKNGS